MHDSTGCEIIASINPYSNYHFIFVKLRMFDIILSNARTRLSHKGNYSVRMTLQKMVIVRFVKVP